MQDRDKDAREKKSATKKATLAGKLFSDAMLIASIRFYVYQLGIKGSQITAALLDSAPMPHFPWKRHMAAARRVMAIKRGKRSDGQRFYELPGNVELRVKHRIGLELWTPEFKMLNPHLTLDKAMENYAEDHPILARTICFLMQGEERVAAKEAQAESMHRMNPETGQILRPAAVIDYMPAEMRHRFTRLSGRK